ncbi:hemerythrin domain-containing protein [Mycolicibacillus parakoreensis]|uniref:Hemerythrin domain-containing protein n=1 Tax=Mycolicibacillus parakoreensis TaxID=1069221 RepID=A0ABY3U1M8_9MYCO|nr:hemerythrin domain-containing protein [Mycolicibacillus parakoreensis]MCV7314877.1 hemerythrin domain-containing protein [Mycolicibacillus parakoreensis]ULN53871.1 hemerythrin domain-containing protein [Mycolicibacillus parakoreensis]
MSNAYDVLREHHDVLRGLGTRLKAAPVGSAERQRILDELLVEFDIHMRIEDDIYYPALAAASRLIAIAHAEHRQVYDALATALRTPTTSPDYEDEWNFFLTVLEAHADEEERDLIPPPAPLSFTDEQLEDLGAAMSARMTKLRNSRWEHWHVKSRAALLRAM